MGRIATASISLRKSRNRPSSQIIDVLDRQASADIELCEILASDENSDSVVVRLESERFRTLTGLFLQPLRR